MFGKLWRTCEQLPFVLWCSSCWWCSWHVWVCLHCRLANWNHQLQQVLLVRTLSVSIFCLCCPTTLAQQKWSIFHPNMKQPFKYCYSWIRKALSIFHILIIPTSSSYWHMLVKPDIYGSLLAVFGYNWDAVLPVKWIKCYPKVKYKKDGGQAQALHNVKLRSPTGENQTQLLGSFP